ncbi:endoribonuclease Dicer-like [Photinus pyralis]|uniref:endoribonuclease Dicer-like n=1 Tax=Photinus pyralis TaxID=7054 RepID=UPI001266F050|nr:endoribonuclease Dicer-like [Photinus pyralis]
MANTMEVDIKNEDFEPRDYQITIMEIAIKKNTIIFLPTGTGKTLIAVMILKRLSEPLQRPLSQGGKLSIMLVNTVALVEQQSKYLRSLTDQDVGAYSGYMNVDLWDDSVWLEQFEKYQILVMTSQVLVNILQRAILSLKDVNLLIFDECHNGVDDHPMCQIMSFCTHLTDPPRIIGLSATLLNKNCKPIDVLDEVKVLEKTFQSKVATVEDLECLIGYATNPLERISVYSPYTCSTADSLALDELNQLIRILEEVKLDTTLVAPPKPYLRPLNTDKHCKPIIRLIYDIIYHIENYGGYCSKIATTAHMIQLERIKKNCQDDKVEAVIDAVITTFEIIQKIYDNAMASLNKLERIYRYSSPQVNKLFNILKEYKSNAKVSLCGIIFVQRRFTAKVIYNVLKELKELDPTFSFINPNYIVGFNSNPYNETREDCYKTKMNKMVLNDFRMKKINLLVSSNVLEEGVDIPTCTLVVHFSDIHNYRGYIQSKGRARHTDSFYYMLVSQEDHGAFMQKYQIMKEIERVLNLHLVGKNEERKDEIDAKECDDLIPPYYVDGPDSSKIDLLTAIPLLCFYCSCLPADKYTTYVPGWFIEICPETRRYRVTIELPPVSGILQLIQGPFMETKKFAKRAAALETCKFLHRLGELDNKLLPRRSIVIEKDFDHYFTHWPTEKEKNAGGTKKQRVHDKKIPTVCKGLIVPKKTVYLHVIELQPLFSSNSNLGIEMLSELYKSQLCYGLLSMQKLPRLCQFSVHVTAGEVLVNLNVNYREVCLTEEEILHLKGFHCLIFRDLLRILKSYLVLGNDGDNDGLLLVPVKRYATHVEIDMETAINNKELIDQKTPLTDEEKLCLDVCDDNYRRSIVTPWYRADDQQYLVIRVCEELNAYSAFPSEEFTTYADYFNAKYHQNLLNGEQPLLLVKGLSKRLNCIKPRQLCNKKKREKIYEDLDEHLIPELCVKQDFPADLWLQARLIPTILNRILSLLQADELRLTIAKETGLGTREIAEGEKWAPLVSDEHTLIEEAEEDNQSKRSETPQDEMVKNDFEIPMIELVQDFAEKKLHAEYPWDALDEPIDLERYHNVTLMDIQYFDQFMSHTLSTDYHIQTNNLASKSTLPAIKFDKEYVYKEIKFLKSKENVRGPELVDIFTALATAKNNDIVNLERLETLGDSFLKLSISLFLVLKYPTYNEGVLTSLKGKLISNKNLFYIGSKKDIGGYMKVSDFTPKFEWKPPSFTIPKVLKDRLNQTVSINSLFQVNFTTEEQISGILSSSSGDEIIAMNDDIDADDEEVAYDSINGFLDKQTVKDKSIADCVEALLGVYFQTFGFKGGLTLLKWLEIIPQSENIENLFQMTPPNPILNKNATESNINHHIPTWKKVEEKLQYKFQNRAYLLQALTHSSYTSNRITNCYQTLEFLGDAVLDFLITCHIYEACGDLSPGDLTDLRSALVNNVTFASFTVRCGFQKHLQFSNNQLLKYINTFVEHQESNNHTINEEVLTLIDEDDLHLGDHIDVPKVLGDAFEALIGAVFLDSGMCLETVWKIVHRIMWKEIELFSINVPKNPIRMIHETVGAHPEFGASMNLDDGRTLMKLEFMINGAKKIVHGVGENKGLAKKAAAKIALRFLHK